MEVKQSFEVEPPLAHILSLLTNQICRSVLMLQQSCHCSVNVFFLMNQTLMKNVDITASSWVAIFVFCLLHDFFHDIHIQHNL